MTHIPQVACLILPFLCNCLEQVDGVLYFHIICLYTNITFLFPAMDQTDYTQRFLWTVSHIFGSICSSHSCYSNVPVFWSSTLSLTSTLDGVAGERHSPATLPLGKRPSTHCTQTWVGPQGQSELVQKISWPPGFDPWTVQSTMSHCTD